MSISLCGTLRDDDDVYDDIAAVGGDAEDDTDDDEADNSGGDDGDNDDDDSSGDSEDSSCVEASVFTFMLAKRARFRATIRRQNLGTALAVRSAASSPSVLYGF